MHFSRRSRRSARTHPLDREHPVRAEVERQLVVKAVHERRAVSIQEIDEADASLLGMALGKRLGTGARELAPQRFVTALLGADDLLVQRVEVVLHPPERVPRGVRQRRVDGRHDLVSYSFTRDDLG